MDTTCQYANSCTPHHTLPFTGLDLVMVIAVGLAIVIAGACLRIAK